MTGAESDRREPVHRCLRARFQPGYAGNNAFSRSIVHGPFNYEADLCVTKNSR